MPKNIKVLIADESEDFREGVKSAIDKRNGIEVIGSVGSGTAMLESIEKLKPDFVLFDPVLSGMDGLSAVRSLARNEFLPMPVLCILTGFSSPAMMNQAMAAGVSAYLLKPYDPDMLAEIAVDAFGLQLGCYIGMVVLFSERFVHRDAAVFGHHLPEHFFGRS